jgi:Mrp family chromosome partitioning ATPase
MVKPKDISVRKSSQHPNWVVPLTSEENENLKFLSFGHVNPKAGVAGAGGKGAAIMRGPIVSRVINQLMTATEWGNLDYLIIDMPPGTGDIQITLTQSISLTGSIVVTTPHPLSTVDASKGLQMFDSLHVPVLALVENMSYFKCDQGKVYHPFGKGGKEALIKGLLQQEGENVEGGDDIASTKAQLESYPIHQFPLAAELAGHASSEQGEVYQLPRPDAEVAVLYEALADDMLLQIARQSITATMIPSMSFDSSRGVILRYFGTSSVEEFAVPCWQIRDRDPLTGELLPTAPSDSERQTKYGAIEPVKFDTKGNYGVSIIWSDGHYADIFPFEVLRTLAEEVGRK